MMKESQQNTTAPSTDELDNADLSDVELKKTDSPQIPVSSHLVMLLEPIMFVYALYIGAISPLSDQYVRTKISKDYNLTVDYANNSGDSSGYCSNNSNRHMNDEIDSQASLWILYSNIASLLPGIVSLILLGSYSDRGGRKVAIIVPQVGALIRCISVLAIIYFDWPLFVIVIGAFLEGLTGGISMVISAGFSYVADITSNNRSFKMTFLESCFGLGTMVSQVAAGYLIASLGYFYPFLILAIIILLDLGIAACFLPETVTRDPGARFWSLGHFRKAFNLYCRDNGTGRRWKLLLSLSIVFFTCLVTLGRTDVQIFYLLDVPFCWSPVLIGYFGAMFMLIAAPGAVLMTKLTQSTFGDSGLMLIGTISGVAYQAVMAFSVTTLLVFMVFLSWTDHVSDVFSAPVAGAASNLVAPMVRAISSKLVKREEEGALFATIALAIALSVLVGQVIFNNIYSATVFVWAPLTFLAMLGTLCFTSLLAVVFLIKEKLEKRQAANSDEEALVNS